jgi:hypothetical protein
MSSDLKKWAETPDKELYEISKDWAKRFTLRKLRSFQQHYLNCQEKEHNKDNLLGLVNMWKCATWAIDYKEFGD